MIIYKIHLYIHFITIYSCKNSINFAIYQTFSDKCANIGKFFVPLQTRVQVDTFADLNNLE